MFLKLRNKLNFYLVILIIAITPTFWLIIRHGTFPIQDDLQAFRLLQMDKCFKDLQIPCRWVPDGGFGYGYPIFNYYSPLPFYIGEILHLLGFSLLDSINILFIFGFIGSSVSMFLFLKNWLGNYPALVGAILYSYVPFKATEVYVRGALGEFWALTFFPLIFWSIQKVSTKRKVRDVIFLSLSLSGLFLTHNLMSIMFLPVSLVWSLFQILLTKKFKALYLNFLGFFLSLLMSAFFLLPLIFEKQYVHLETLTGGYFDYRQHFVSFAQLFFSNHFGYGSSILGTQDDLSLSTGLIHWILGLLSIFIAILVFKKNKAISLAILVLSATEVFTLFLIHQKSHLIWEYFDFMKFIQFPWRFLGLSAFLLSILSALLVYLIPDKKLKLALGLSAIFAVMILHGIFFKPKGWLVIEDKDKFSNRSWDLQRTVSIFDYLPMSAKFPPDYPAPKQPEILDGQASILKYDKGSYFQKGEINVFKQATLRAPIYDFPGFEVLLDGKIIPHTRNDCRKQKFCLGLITFQAPVGNHQIMVVLRNTAVRTIGNTLTIIGFFLLIMLTLKRHEINKSTKD